MEIFEYAFMQRAFIVGILLAAIIPCIGLVIVCKRLSMIGDAPVPYLAGWGGGRAAPGAESCLDRCGCLRGCRYWD